MSARAGTRSPKIAKRSEARPTSVAPPIERRLAALLSADIKGYSRLMGEDEEGTLQTLTTYREVMANVIAQHRGRVVNYVGDNVLAEFASAVDAVQG